MISKQIVRLQVSMYSDVLLSSLNYHLESWAINSPTGNKKLIGSDLNYKSAVIDNLWLLNHST